MGQYKKLWWTFIILLTVCFLFLGWGGKEVYYHAPPIPGKVVSESGEELFTKDDILKGQSAWQSVGGMELGSVYGHGAMQAPDWTADWLHRELEAWLEIAANDEYGKTFAELGVDEQAILKAKLKVAYRTNMYDEAADVLTISERRIAAMAVVFQYYDSLFGPDASFQTTRQNFAMKENTMPNAEDRVYFSQFIFWTSWTAAANRPGYEHTYTHNWPPEPLIDNVPTAENIAWSLASVIALIAGLGLMVWFWAFLRGKEEEDPTYRAPETDFIASFKLTPSQQALKKYCFVVVALFIFQILLGGFTAHYTLEGQGFYGIDISQWIPYSLARTWHLQTALFWIATAFLTAGLYLAPIINGGRDPRFQKLGVNLLFWALIAIVVGSFAGEYLAIAGKIPRSLNFWFGHQGYEYLDLGRFWHWLLFIGLLFWFGLMMNGIISAFKNEKKDKNLLALFVLACAAVGIFYGAGLVYGEHTHIAIMEYWRWWVVHLWVEGFLEVFATVSFSFLFYTLGLVPKRLATAAALTASTVFLVGGIPGTFHHLYFTGVTTPVIAIGATFSALEVVPLLLIGYEAWQNWSVKDKAPWMKQMHWPLVFFAAMAFWNMLGAGVFGFMVNPPVVLFYSQGLNTSAVHSHAALFGVYGFLALGFVLLVIRYISPNVAFNDRLMKTGFWGLNVGLCLMIFTALLPHGIIQFMASISEGMWYARGEELMQSEILRTLRWVRTIGDVVFIIGGLCVTWQVLISIFKKADRTQEVEASARETAAHYQQQ